MTLKNTSDLSEILERSIKSELISTSIAAREIIDVDRFYSYNSMSDILSDWEAYSETLESLRSLKRMVGATYIYALKLIDGTYYFVFDTDEYDDTLLDPYDISYVHERAFRGEDYAGIMNVIDEFGSFNTGAVPIWKDNKVIGIISTDIEDTLVQASRSASARNAAVLIVSLVATIGIMIVTVWLLLRNVRKMQEQLFRMANFDVLTDLPNRQYLLTYLGEVSERALKHNEPFAFLLIDLDNFKNVNDGAGHDAGDELLRNISVYLGNIHESSKSFRPPAGILNVSARVGGDEFVQIIPGISTEAEAELAAKKVLDNFHLQSISPFIKKYNVGLSIGIALFPSHSSNFHVLIKYADIAMYHAKREGKHTYRVFNHEMGGEDKQNH
jgi:diguanylate cyclase (GGDEF)-like protein